MRAHLYGASVNDPNRRHYTFAQHRPGFLFKIGRSAYELFDAEQHGEYRLDGSPVAEGEALAGDDNLVDTLLEELPAAQATVEFALELYLEEFLLSNWASISWGAPLRLLADPSGHQYATPLGRLDFLAVDTTDNALVVIELKRGRPADQVVGQILRYMGWITHNQANGRPVRGLIIASEIDDKLKYAASMIPGLRLMAHQTEIRQ